MFFENLEKQIQKRYPTIHLKWNDKRKLVELQEHHGGPIGNGWRFLWAYENPDGSRLPVIYDRVIEWLLKADTRNWHWQDKDLFREIMNGRAKAEEQSKKEMRDAIEDRILEDYNYIAGIPTFFMDPTSMPEARAKYRPGQEEILRNSGS
jgi:hypothetical protein